jgi:hypothetical protein
MPTNWQAPYVVGRELTCRRIPPPWLAKRLTPRLVLKIIKVLPTWNFACTMVVQAVHPGLGKPGDRLVLKLFDWRFAPFYQNTPWPEADEDIKADLTLDRYQTELKIYRRLQNYQGKLLPRFIDTVMLDTPGFNDRFGGGSYHPVGILSQFVVAPNLSLEHETKGLGEFVYTATACTWQLIGREMRRIVRVLGDQGIIHSNIGYHNFIVLPNGPGWRVLLVNLDGCRLRRDDEWSAKNPSVWAMAKCSQDQEITELSQEEPLRLHFCRRLLSLARAWRGPQTTPDEDLKKILGPCTWEFLATLHHSVSKNPVNPLHFDEPTSLWPYPRFFR